MIQGPGLNTPSTAQEGGSIEIEVSNGSTEVEVVVNRTGDRISVSVGANGKVTIPVPSGAKAGDVLSVTTIGKPPPLGAFIEVISLE